MKAQTFFGISLAALAFSTVSPATEYFVAPGGSDFAPGTRKAPLRTNQLGYEDANGSPFKIDKDYFAKKRNRKHPTPGPFETPGLGSLSLKVR